MTWSVRGSTQTTSFCRPSPPRSPSATLAPRVGAAGFFELRSYLSATELDDGPLPTLTEGCDPRATDARPFSSDRSGCKPRIARHLWRKAGAKAGGEGYVSQTLRPSRPSIKVGSGGLSRSVATWQGRSLWVSPQRKQGIPCLCCGLLRIETLPERSSKSGDASTL